MINKIKKEHEQFLKKLKVKYPLKIDKFYKTKNIGQINRIFYSKGRKIWFAHSENENKYFYIFGIVNSSPDDVSLEDYILIYDFPKNEIYNENCLGMINKNNLYVNKNILIKKYRDINLNNYSIKKSAIFQGTYFNVETIDIGNINRNFIENLEKLIKEIEKIKPVSRENLFLNSIKAGKTVEESLKITNITKEELDLWLESGKNNDKKYAKFYKKYNELINSGVSKTANDNLMTSYYNLVSQNKTINFAKDIPKMDIIKMNVFLDEYSKDKKLRDSLKKANLDLNTFNSWIKKGKDKSSEYNKFYKEYTKIKESSKIIKNSDKTSENHELVEKFIKLKHEGKTNKEALEQTNIPQHLVKNWINQGKLGNIEYYNFYQAYNIDNTPKPKVKEKTLLEYGNNKKEEKTTPNKCSICGRSLNKNSEKNICKRCLRKQYAVSILEKLLPSIEPGIPFRKDDLKLINLKKLQIQDYIWTLQEFNLITKKNSKYILKPRDTLDKFARECNLEIKIDEKTSVSLNKTCETCGETLEISNFYTSENSDDGYENNCKKCKKLIKSAVFLKQLNKYVKWEDEFSENDLKPYFKDTFQLKGNIWNLLENDLIKNKFNTQNYILTDEKTGLEFIKKYYKEEYDTPIESPQIKEHKKSTIDNDREIVLEAISRRKTRKEAAEIANIPLYKITHWYNEGRQGFGKENINFYKKLKKLEKNNEIYNAKHKEQENKQKIKNDYPKNEYAENISENILNELLVPLEEKYEILFKSSKMNKTGIAWVNIVGKSWVYQKKHNNHEIRIRNHNIYSLYQEVKYKNLPWGIRDSNRARYYILEYFNINPEDPQPTTEDTFLNTHKTYDEGIYAPLPEEYETAFKSSPMNQSGIAWVNKTGSQWNYTKQVYGKLIKFTDKNIYKLYEKVKKSNNIWGIRDYSRAKNIIDIPEDFKLPKNEIKINNSKNIPDIIDPDIYAPLPEKYETAFKSSPMNQSGIAWVNKTGTGSQWNYEKQMNGELIRFTDENIYKLYEKVKKSNNIWGIRDYSRAKKFIDIPGNFEIPQKEKIIKPRTTIPDNIDPDIYAPLPQYLNFTFNSSPSNKTGIAWVNKSGSNWRYSRKIDGKTEVVVDENIYELHKKVKYLGFDWGIRDYDKARRIIKIPKNYQPNYQEEKEELINTNIYAPLPKRYIRSFNQNQENKTGIAWVSQANNKWVYQRKVDGTKIKFMDSDIKKLHEVVIKNNHVWGIINFEKAAPIIENNTLKHEIYSEFKIKPANVLDKNIFAPLSKEYNPPETETGIAWVEIEESRFIYSKIKNGMKKEYANKNINELFNIVKFEGLEWGIINYDKAKKYINIPKDFSPQEYNLNIKNSQTLIKKEDTSNINVFVNYIKITENDINIIIRGMIKNNEFISILNKLKPFENNFKRIISNSVKNETDIFIELNLNSSLLKTFEETISDFNWIIKK